MTDLVSQLVGALELAVRQGEHDMLLTGEELRQCIAALTAAEAGGWVAVPVEPTPEMLKTGLTALFDRKLPPAPWEDCIAETYAAMLAARPTTLPKEAA